MCLGTDWKETQENQEDEKYFLYLVSAGSYGGYSIYQISLTCIYLRSVYFPVGKFYFKKKKKLQR